MSALIIRNHLINAPMITILKQVKSELVNGKLAIIEDKGDHIKVTCPNSEHKGGFESKPSCYVYSGNSSDVEYGLAHCFTCGKAWRLPKFIGMCFDTNEKFGEDWLIERFGDTYVQKAIDLKPIELNIKEEKVKSIIDESVLDTFESYHPYMTQRRISNDIIDLCQLKYDKNLQAIVFPVRDKEGNLVAFTKRSVKNKTFYIPKNFDKSNIYLLDLVYKNNYNSVYITESQINALVSYSYGRPAIATFGAGLPDTQIKVLNSLPVKQFIVAFDPDRAGLKGTLKLCNNISKNKFVNVMILPKGKDIGDLTKEEFENCKIIDRYEFTKHIPIWYNN